MRSRVRGPPQKASQGTRRVFQQNRSTARGRECPLRSSLRITARLGCAETAFGGGFNRSMQHTDHCVGRRSVADGVPRPPPESLPPIQQGATNSDAQRRERADITKSRDPQEAFKGGCRQVQSQTSRQAQHRSDPSSRARRALQSSRRMRTLRRPRRPYRRARAAPALAAAARALTLDHPERVRLPGRRRAGPACADRIERRLRGLFVVVRSRALAEEEGTSRVSAAQLA